MVISRTARSLTARKCIAGQSKSLGHRQCMNSGTGDLPQPYPDQQTRGCKEPTWWPNSVPELPDATARETPSRRPENRFSACFALKWMQSDLQCNVQ